MSNAIEIVEPKESDLATITDLVAELSEFVDGPEKTDWQMIDKNVRKLFLDPASHFLIAKAGEAVVGFINFTTRRTIDHPSESGLIDELIVKDSHRGRGVGKKLVLEAAEKCRQLGCCEIEVSTLITNTRAREFYKKCGFKEEAMLLEMDLEP